MNAVNTFAALRALSDSSYYAALGLAGLTTGFTAYCVCSPTPVASGSGQIIGNYDEDNSLGWRIYVDSTGLHANIGDGSATIALDGGDYAGHWVLAQLTVNAYDGSNTRASLYVNGRRVDSDATLTSAYAPTSGLAFSVGYNLNNAADALGASLVSGFGLISDAALDASNIDAGMQLWLGTSSGGLLANGLSQAVGGRMPANMASVFTAGTLKAYSVAYDNDGAHPPPVTGLNFQFAAASWAPYQGTSPILTRTGTPIVGTAAMPWA